MAPADRTDDILKRASAHLFYEFDMLRETAAWLLQNDSRGKQLAPDKQVAWNVYLEAFLIHARNLLVCIGWRKANHPDDVRVKDFVPGWIPKVPTESWVDDVYNQVSGRIAHLSYSRLDPPEKWPIRSITEGLESEVLRFIRLVPAHLKDGQWDQPFGPVFSPHSLDYISGVTTYVRIIKADDFFNR